MAVTTDIIVGFPGETEADFERTLEVAAEARYDSAYTFIYSPRPGTEAAERVADFVDPAVVGERFDRLRVVVERSGLAKHEARVGRVEVRDTCSEGFTPHPNPPPQGGRGQGTEPPCYPALLIRRLPGLFDVMGRERQPRSIP